MVESGFILITYWLGVPLPVDMFGDHTLSGWGRSGAILLIVVAWLAAFIYLIARGKSITNVDGGLARQQASQEKHIQSVAAKTATPAEQITSAKSAAGLDVISHLGVHVP